MAFPSDLEIARGAALKPLEDVAAGAGIPSHLLEPYGEEVAKIKLAAIGELADRPTAKYVVVSAVTPTPLGEGKTTTAVGLGQGFAHIGKRATVAIRQPSMGPTFGIKGGAAGGGYSQVVPMDGGAEPAPHWRHACDHRGEQPACRDDRQPHLSGQRARHRRSERHLAAGGRCQRPGVAQHRYRPRRARRRDTAADRFRYHRRVRGDGHAGAVLVTG